MVKRLLCGALGLFCSVAASGAVPVYKDANFSVEDRVADLLSRMTPAEKVAQLEAQGAMPAISPGGARTAAGIFVHGGIDEAIAKATLANGVGAFALMGVDPIGAEEGARQQNMLQAWVLKNTRLGIPIIFQAEALHGAIVGGATSFPQAIGLGSTWDPKLIRQMFDVVGREARASGMTQVLAPVLDLARDPRFGRTEEMYSEDPFLTGTLGVAAVQGLQGASTSIAPDHVIATAKHFVHGQPENGTNVGPNDYSERTMRSIFLEPFEMAVKSAKIGAVMPSYNENDGGVPSHANSWLLRDVLRGEWGFSGMTVSDWGGVPKLHDDQFLADSKETAGRIALAAGVDMELPTPVSFPSLVEAVASGKVKQSDIDAAVGRVLTAKFESGLFEHPFANVAAIPSIVGSARNGALARKVADEAIVLLKNDQKILPINPDTVKTIAIIGPNADKVRLGTYSGAPPYYVSVLDGIRKRLGGRVSVTYAEGVRISEPDKSPYLNRILPYRAPSAEENRQLTAQAVEVAKAADTIILVLGGNEAVSREAFGAALGNDKASLGDSDTLDLPSGQDELVRQIALLKKPTVAVLLNGRPYAVTNLVQSVPAIIEGWYLGQETGNAVAGVIFGDVNPSGRLPVSIARNVGQLPVFYNRTPASRLGYVFDDNSPLFPFGFGLSYTDFRFGEPSLDSTVIGTDGVAHASISVANSGKRTGDEVVQMYARVRYASVVQPILRLVAFKRVHLTPGASESATFDLGPEQLAIWGADMKKRVEPCEVDIGIGPNSADLKFVSLHVK